MSPQTENPATELPAPAPEPATFLAHRGNGKIARLPKLVRDKVNSWMLDGLSYPEIIQRLGEHGQDLKPNNLFSVPVGPDVPTKLTTGYGKLFRALLAVGGIT